jgi:hypothetical protein
LDLSLMMAGAAGLAVAVPLHAQGKSNSQGNGHKSTPPSGSPLPSPTTGPATGASPLAWLDDASLLAPGSMSLTLSIMRWSGTDLSEVDVPVVEASVGLAPDFRRQRPRISSAAPTARGPGGIGVVHQ